MEDLHAVIIREYFDWLAKQVDEDIFRLFVEEPERAEKIFYGGEE
jgi:hypothetical protein